MILFATFRESAAHLKSLPAVVKSIPIHFIGRLHDFMTKLLLKGSFSYRSRHSSQQFMVFTTVDSFVYFAIDFTDLVLIFGYSVLV